MSPNKKMIFEGKWSWQCGLLYSSLLKKGDKKALKLFDIKNSHKCKVESFDLQKTTVKIGEDLIFFCN